MLLLQHPWVLLTLFFNEWHFCVSTRIWVEFPFFENQSVNVLLILVYFILYMLFLIRLKNWVLPDLNSALFLRRCPRYTSFLIWNWGFLGTKKAVGPQTETANRKRHEIRKTARLGQLLNIFHKYLFEIYFRLINQ